MARKPKAAQYRNVNDGRVLDRPAGPDKWLEASPEWERVKEPAPGEDNERTDD